MDEENSALFPFGWGLSYTRFSYSQPTISRGEVPVGFDELNFYNVEMQRTVEPTTFKIWVGGSSLATAETALVVE